MTKLHRVNPPLSEVKFVGDEPIWGEGEVTDKNYNMELLRGLNWHGYCATDKNYRKYLEEWIRTHHPNDAKKRISFLKGTRRFNPTFASLARLHLRNFPLNERHIQHIENYINDLGQQLKKNARKKKTTTTNRPNVQEAMARQLSEVFAEIDGFVDNAFNDEVMTAKNMMNEIFNKRDRIKAPHIRLINKYIQENYLDEWVAAIEGKDEDLNEGYSFIGKRPFKKIIKEFETLIDDLSKHATQNKTKRIARKRPVDKRKMVSSMKYMESLSLDGIELTSEDPVKIIGSNLVWVYNSKNRRLGYYESEVKNSLYVKGTTIHGFKNGFEKILRKPEEQLKEFNSLRKNQAVNWFNDINAKEKEMSGRINNNVIILKVD